MFEAYAVKQVRKAIIAVAARHFDAATLNPDAIVGDASPGGVDEAVVLVGWDRDAWQARTAGGEDSPAT